MPVMNHIKPPDKKTVSSSTTTRIKQKTAKTALKTHHNRKSIEKDLDKLWAELVKQRDKGKCIRCGKPAVHSHHIFSRRHKRTRWNINNGISLCFRDHWHWVNSSEPQDKQEYFDLIYRLTDVDELKRQSGIVWKPTISELENLVFVSKALLKDELKAKS